MRSPFRQAVFILALACSCIAIAQPEPAAPEETSAQPRYQELALGEDRIRFAILLPARFDPEREYPALLALPPGAQNEAMVEAGLSRYWEAGATDRGWIIVSPINPETAELFQSDEAPLPALMDHVRSRFKVEGGTFHLAGVSNGGRAAFIEALAHPDRYASLTVLPGLLEDGTDPDRVQRLSKMPVTLYVGGDDEGWLRESERTYETLKASGIDATLIIREGEGHVVSIKPDVLFDLLDSRRPEPDADAD